MNPLNRAIATLAKLKTTNSVKDKELILRNELDNHPLQVLLEANLNPYKMYYIKKLPKYEKLEVLSNQLACWKLFLETLDNLSSRVITGNLAIEHTTFLLSATDDPDFEEVMKTVIFKAPIGVGATTVNKVWPGLIPTFDVMLAPSELANVTNLKYPTYIQPKLDGFRCIYMPLGGEITLWSRSGKPFGNKQLISHFKALGSVSDLVLDGELYSHEMSFESLVSVLTTEEASIPKDLKFVVYDCVPLKDWNNKNCKLSYEKRLKLLRETLNDLVADYKKVIDIESIIVHNSKDLVDIYKNHLDRGYEGSMIKSIDGKYQWKRVTARSGEMLKLKPFKSIDVAIESIYDGEGSFEGMAGGVGFTYGNTTVRCGSGFDVATREKMAKQPSKYIGKTIEIKYFEETEDGSLRFPTFVRFREDKDK